MDYNIQGANTAEIIAQLGYVGSGDPAPSDQSSLVTIENQKLEEQMNNLIKIAFALAFMAIASRNLR